MIHMSADHPKLRSEAWFDKSDDVVMRHRGVLHLLGYDPYEVVGRPIIGICNPRSDLNNCEYGFDELAAAIKRGIEAAGAIPMEFATMTLGGELCKPADMLYRNLVSMSVEETLRGYPIDGVVLLCNCDKTTPAQLMAAASADVPAMQFCGGPRDVGDFNGEPFSCGTDMWRVWDEFRGGRIGEDEWRKVLGCVACSHGACNEMGTNSTMTAISEALGMMVPGTSTIPATDPARIAAAEATGGRIVELVQEDLRPGAILTRDSFENAIRVCMACGGSTNAIFHLTAIAGRRGIELPLSLFNDIAAETPLLVNMSPSGKYLLPDLHRAGGVPALLKQLTDQLHGECPTVAGRTIGQIASEAVCRDDDVIRSRDTALSPGGALTVLTGNLAPDGAVLKASAGSSELFQHTGPALVFDSYEEMISRIDTDDLPVTPQTVLLLRNIGPRGAPGIPEWGSIPMPAKLLKQGVKDMLRISDGRMSGTSYGTVILHCAPEAAAEGPLAIVRDGDEIRVDVENRRLDVLISDDELRERLTQWSPPTSLHLRGYPRLYIDHVVQADRGCDFDFLRPASDESLSWIEPIIGRS